MVSGSALYDCSVVHHRLGPVEHRFARPVLMPLFDLAEVAEVCAGHPLWSDRRPAPVRFARRDYLGPADVPLDQAVRDLVARRTGSRPTGPVRLLALPRSWGWTFNPISCYFCFDGEGRHVEAMVAEVTNTPWHERHAYVVGGPGTYEMDKSLHVSPFFPMDQTYRLAYSAPAERLAVSITVEQAGQPVLRASITGRRGPLDRRALGRLVRSPRRTSPGVTAGIYLEALALWRRGATYHPHPRPTDGASQPAVASGDRGRG